MDKCRGPGWSPWSSLRKKGTLTDILCLMDYPYSRRNSSVVTSSSYLVGLDARHFSPASYAYVQLNDLFLTTQGATIIWLVMYTCAAAVLCRPLETASSSAHVDSSFWILVLGRIVHVLLTTSVMRLSRDLGSTSDCKHNGRNPERAHSA